MCRNIRLLFNFAPPATDDEVRAAAIQYVRKVSGTRKPSAAWQYTLIDSTFEGQREAEPGVPGTWFQVAIIETATGAMIGDCGLHCLSAGQTELGITLAPIHQGRGYATEALGAVIACLFGPLGMHRVSAITDAENYASAALFRRLGFRQETHFIDHVWCWESWGSEYGFALSREEWELRKANGH